MALALVGAPVASAIAYPVVARAEEPPDFPKSYRAFMKMAPMHVMHMMDEGKKGYVTKEEYMKFHEALFDQMDKNHDGKVTVEEWMAKRGGERAK